jgi:hypothetical protein
VSGPFLVHVDDGVVIVEQIGDLQFDETNKAIAAAVAAARGANSKRVLFDLTRAQLANYYSYTVRHAELAPDLGLDVSYALAFVGRPEADDVLSFIALTTRNRGWKSRYFFDRQAALEWLAA